MYTIDTHFKGITYNVYGFGRLLLIILLHRFFTRPPISLPIHNMSYPSNWQVDWSLHKTMHLSMIGALLYDYKIA